MKVYTKKLHSAQHLVASKILSSLKKYFVLCFGRGWGKTFMVMELIYLYATAKKETIYFIAPTYKLGAVIFKFVLQKYKGSGFVTASNKEMMEITLLNGSTITFYSYDKYENLRGLNFATKIFCDEAAKLSDEGYDEVLNYICSQASVEKVFYISTPRGKNWFYRKAKEAEVEGSETMFISASSLTNPLLTKDTREKYEKLVSIGTPKVMQEIKAEFVETGGSVFQNLDNLFCLDGYAKQSDWNYLVIDVAKLKDYTVLMVFNKKGQLVYFDRFNKKTYPVLAKKIIEVAKRFNCRKIGIDGNGAGESVVDMIEELAPELKTRITKITTGSNKSSLIEELEKAIDLEEIELPAVEGPLYGKMKVIEDELSAFDSEKTKSGNIVYFSTINDDTVMGLAYFVFLKKKKTVRIAG